MQGYGQIKPDKKFDLEIRVETIRRMLEKAKIKIEDAPIDHKLTPYDRYCIIGVDLTAKQYN